MRGGWRGFEPNLGVRGRDGSRAVRQQRVHILHTPSQFPQLQGREWKAMRTMEFGVFLAVLNDLAIVIRRM